MTLWHSTNWASIAARARMPRWATHAVFMAIVAMTVSAAAISAIAQGSPSANYRRERFPAAGGTSAPLIGGIFQADLNNPVYVIGCVETFNGCPDGDTGQWTITPPPGDGTATGVVIGGTPLGGCAPNPPCDAAGPNPAGTLQCFGTLQYTLTQPIPCGQNDTLGAAWQSSHGVTESGMWEPAYIPLAVTHNFFGPCSPLCHLGPEYHLAVVCQLAACPGRELDAEHRVLQMGQSGLVSSQLINSVPSNWSIVGQRDFNGDGYTDLLWREAPRVRWQSGS